MQNHEHGGSSEDVPGGKAVPGLKGLSFGEDLSPHGENIDETNPPPSCEGGAPGILGDGDGNVPGACGSIGQPANAVAKAPKTDGLALAMSVGSTNFYGQAIQACLEEASCWLSSTRASDEALYNILQKVVYFEADSRFELESFCSSAGRRFTKATRHNPFMVILEEIMKKAGGGITSKTSSKYGRVLHWVVAQCDDLAAVAQYFSANGGIEGVDTLRRKSAVAPTPGNKGRPQGAACNSARILNVPMYLPENTKIVAVLDHGHWQFLRVELEAPPDA